jgi:hypothetical protein
LVTPPHHLSDGQNLSNLWGPAQSSLKLGDLLKS